MRALLDTPDAFGATYERGSSEPDGGWREWAADCAEGGSSFLAFAVDDHTGQLGGLAMGAPHDDVHDAIGLFAMWVDPTLRGRGLGRRLVEAVVAWARTTERPRVVLAVNEANEEAIRLYARCGFAPTGTRRPIRDGSSIMVISMTRAL